ncbi:hypothetical protein CRV24_010442 [Beauveria bassiana]|nr:hypothetical protein CRV24_010442 [Beauveria bassiana]
MVRKPVKDYQKRHTMEQPAVHPMQKRDRTRDNFVRSTMGLMKRSNRISQLYDADMYVLVRWKNRHFMYCSTEEQSFPPAAGILHKVYPPVVKKKPADFVEKDRRNVVKKR